MDFEIARKALIGLGIAGGTCGGGAYMLMPRIQKNVIIKKLEEKKYTILTDDPKNTSHWQAILDSYKSSTGQGYLQFDGFSGNEDGALGKLQKLCHEITKPFVSSNKKSEVNYKKAEKWCIEPVSIASILGQWGTRVLNNEDSAGNTDNGQWEEKIKTFKREKEIKDKKIRLVVLSSGDGATPEDVKKIKKECKTIGDKKNHDDKYDENLESFKTWCSE